MKLPTFSKRVMRELQVLYEFKGNLKLAQVEARNVLSPDDYGALQTFRKCHSFTFIQAVYHVLNGLNRQATCKRPGCCTQVKWGCLGSRGSYKKYCSTQCSNLDTRESAKKTCLAKFGVENVSQAAEIKQKKIDTCTANHGVAHPMQSKKVRRKSKASVQAHYGVDNVSQSVEVQASKVATFYERYGYSNSSKHPDVKRLIGQRTGSSLARKKIVSVQGKQYVLQGYEPQALTYIKKYFMYKNIHDQSSGKVPSFDYYFDGRDRIYFPDFYVDSDNCIVEVKSLYTLCMSSSTYRMMKAKIKAVEAAGYRMKLLVMESGGRRLKLPQDWQNLNYRQFQTLLQPNHRR